MDERSPSDTPRDEAKAEEARELLRELADAVKTKNWPAAVKAVGFAWYRLHEAYPAGIMPESKVDDFKIALHTINEQYAQEATHLIDEILDLYKRIPHTTQKNARIEMTRALLSLAYQAMAGISRATAAWGQGMAESRAQDALTTITQHAKTIEGADQLREAFKKLLSEISALNDQMEQQKKT